jgi:hypothetical protein
MKKRIFLFIAVACAAVSMTNRGWAAEILLEELFESAKGAPVSEIRNFDGTGFEDLVLRVVNGEPDGTRRVSSATITINGNQLLGPADLNQKFDRVERSLAPRDGSYTLSVNLRSNPGGVLFVQILGESTINLPPDPGPAGAATLEGVDINGNGMRDDVERWIGLTYRQSLKARQALTQAYYPLQGFIIHGDRGDRDAVYDAMTALQRAGECLDYLFPEDGYRMLQELKARTVNTANRVQADRQASRMLGGGSFPGRPLSKWEESCTFDPDALDN